MHFYFTTADRIAEISNTGLRPRDGGHRLARPSVFEDRNGQEVLVIANGAPLPECRELDDRWVSVDSVPSDAFSNLNPYRPVREVVAGGGVVVRRRYERAEVLLIRRKGIWDLPKGKQDEGEEIVECARREVCEELGIPTADVHAPLGDTLHGYSEVGHYVVKRTVWFRMSTSHETFRPQIEEDIDKVCWVPAEAASGVVGYESLRPILDQLAADLSNDSSV